MSTVTIEPWGEGDLPILELSNEPAMMQHLGGPEAHEKLLVRHARYLDGWASGTSFMFRIEADGEPVGGIGYWPTEWHGEQVYETGWSVHTAHQGHGHGTSSLLLVIEHAARHGDRDALHALPRTDNRASNAVCRKAGFRLLGEVDDEYPPGNPIRSNDWAFDLRTRRAG
ncbi:N-acetyltransferase [Glaciihabitans arcticus]|uniref:N-acetyltransferase n=1 Tax=Glaciihabitans arcticus TaxID=2668039 RepID=A0A4Q9GRP2_9MICO|nr:GNAT family N-acetyltransferase [Glaciihabitans arcticus]TBN57235.1 N-acetyltransferase [Glaciihabitans arcticus]